jgi:hypothetical protein
VQYGDLDHADRIFSTIEKKVVFMYGAMFKSKFVFFNKALKYDLIMLGDVSNGCLTKFSNCLIKCQ